MHEKRGSTPVISVHNRQRTVKIDMAKLRRFATRALSLCLELRASKDSALAKLPEIHVILIGDRRMSELHLRFFQIDGPTDVVTFQHGEIFISAQTAQRQARQFGSSLLQEIQLYVVHGLLHLHGFDDKTPAVASLMHAMQQRILRAARTM